MKGLPEYLANNLKVIFVGYNPGERSAIVQHHYAGRGNQFWRLLYDSGLTRRLISPEEDNEILKEGYGLTNLVERPSKSSADLSVDEMKEGAISLRNKIHNYSPYSVCFLGKEVYRHYALLKSSVAVEYGKVSDNQLGTTILFVAPNPSGRSTVPYAEKLRVFKELYELTKKIIPEL